ncbi:MAG: C10 family peptidase [Prevotella sp.]|nr:C10 family peptidase [Prevotella sp.]
MKRTILLTLLSAITIGMMANPVGREEAKEKAAQFLCTSRTAKIKNLQQMERRLQPVEAGFSHLHVFNNGQDGGFIVVSADDRTEEVLAYSEGGTFGDVPVNGGLYEILIGLNSQVADAASDHTFTSRNDTEPQEQDREPIYPMITTSWNQYQPYYDFTPTDPSSGNHTLVGCVAITLAQIMKYYEYPQKTTKTIPAYTTSSGINMPKLSPTTFEYNKMLDYYSSLNTYYYSQEQLNAVHKILKYAGCAVQMDYSSGGSAAIFDIAKIANYFGYRSDAKLLHAAMYPRDTWEDMIYNELAAGRPVPYSAGAVKQQNHQFIIDGYDGRGYFHANTGEFGFFDGLFYCKLHVINDCELSTGPVEFSGYNCYQAAVFNFQPKDSSQPLQDLPAEQNMDGKVSKIVMNGVHFYNPYVEQRTVAIANISNQGETYENMLFLWQGETLKGGVGTYVPPGESGEVVICIASPMETGNYPVRFTTDWEGKDVVFETTLKITEQPECELSGYITQEGFKGRFWVNPETDSPYGYWDWDNDWQYEEGIYENLKIEADITNTSKNRFNSWIFSSLIEQAQEGELYSEQGKGLVNHFYYVDLAPGETKHFTFFFDKHLFNPDKLYYYSIDYSKNSDTVLFSLPIVAKYFPSFPGGLKGDANLDGKINISDVSAIINYILAKDPHPFNSQNADKDNNGLVNISDVTAIINLILAK